MFSPGAAEGLRLERIAFWAEHQTGSILRQALAGGALAAFMTATVSFAAGASPQVNGASPAEPISAQISLLHRAFIYAKDGSKKLVDGRWNLGQSEAKLGIQLSDGDKQQLMACTGQIVCEAPGGRVTASASSVLSPDLLVTAKHVLFNGKRAAVSFGKCSFRSFAQRNVAIPVVVEKDQRKGYVFNNEDFTVVRLKRALEGCNAFALPEPGAALAEGERVFSATAHQRGIMNKVSRREPVLATGTIRNSFEGFYGGPPFYYADLDFDIGGSGGALFALKDGRPVVDDEGRLMLKGIVVAYGLRGKNNKPYSEDRNYTIVVGLEGDFRELVEGKAARPAPVDPAPCAESKTAKIEVIADPVTPAASDAVTASLEEPACAGETGPGRKSGDTNAVCSELAKEAKELARLKRAASRRAKGKQEFRLKNETSCAICFSFDRCNPYGCWDERVSLKGKSMLFAGVRERAPAIKNAQFCDPDARFLAAKAKAEREGAHRLTADDIRGLSLEQLRQLRGY